MSADMNDKEPVPKGFSPQIAKDQRLDEKFLCKICNYILRVPVQLLCGHRFCSDCVYYRIKHHSNEKYCPACLEDMAHEDLCEENLMVEDNVYADNAVKREMKFTAFCINPGCQWSGTFRQYEVHEPKCEFQSFNCVCGSRVLLSRRKEHLENECPLRVVVCPYCGKRETAKTIDAHLEVCDKRPLDCPFCKRKGLKGDEKSSHYNGVCPAGAILCPICKDPVLPRDLNEHVKANVGSHVMRAYEQMREVSALVGPIQESVGQLRSECQALSSQLRNIQLSGGLQGEASALEGGGEAGGARGAEARGAEAGKLDMAAGGAAAAEDDGADSSGLSRQVEALGQRVAVFDSIGSVLNQELATMLQRVETVESRSNAMATGEFTRLQTKIREVEHQVTDKDQQIAELKIQLRNLETASYDGCLVWKITDVTRRREEARSGAVNSIYSHPFFTSRTGYKMCARLYFNGDGMGRGTHLSLYFVVMKGEYDGLMRWPFKQKVTLTLLDFNKREHVSDAFRPDPASSSFRQPVTSMNIASGCPLFCQLTRLDAPGSSLYVKDDTMFIKIAVDLTDL